MARRQTPPIAPLRLALLHLAPMAADIDRNCRALQAAVITAADRGADLAIGPELALSGYLLPAEAGLQDIQVQPDERMQSIAAIAERRRIAVLVGAAERDPVEGTLHNSAFLIDEFGQVVGRSRKVNVAADGWSRSGGEVRPLHWRSLCIGCLICADAYTPDVAARLLANGADVLISPANWPPGVHGPNGEWEARSRETRLPFLVCNRTGREPTLDFSGAESLLLVGGERRLVHRSAGPAVITFAWDPRTGQPLERPVIDLL